MRRKRQVDQQEDPENAFDLEALRVEVTEDPVARATYQDASRRTALLAAMPKIRKASGRTQKQVADLMHTTQSGISELESGRIDLQFRTLQRYARAVKRRLDIAIVDDQLPVFDEGMANGLWHLVEDRSLSPLLTALAVQTRARRNLEQLATFTELPSPVVRPILLSLESRGWVTRSGDSSDPIFSLNDEAASVIGINIHRERITGTLVDLAGTILHRTSTKLGSTSSNDVISATVDVVMTLYGQNRPRDLLGVGVTVPGVVTAELGRVIFAPDLAGPNEAWTGVELEARLEAALQDRTGDKSLLVAVENDANALAAREYLRRGEQHVAVVLLTGLGIGTGLSIGGDIVYGANNAAGEGGHTVIDPSGPPCRAGLSHRGCLETLASAQAMLRRVGIVADTATDVRSALSTMSTRVSEGDSSAAAALRDGGLALGRFLGNTTVLLDPSRIAIFGPKELVDTSTPAAQAFQDGVETGLQSAEVKEKPLYRHTAIEWHRLSDETTAVAAASVAMRHFLYKPVRWRPSVLVTRTITGPGSWR